jgi:hypothetical protein
VVVAVVHQLPYLGWRLRQHLPAEEGLDLLVMTQLLLLLLLHGVQSLVVVYLWLLLLLLRCLVVVSRPSRGAMKGQYWARSGPATAAHHT